jgi:Bacterial protein of unknown function (DUF922)
VHEREPSQATVEPPAPVETPAVVAPTALAGAPAVALALQRSIGNRLVSRALATLARQEPTDELNGAVALDEPSGDPLQQPAAAAAPTPTFDHSGGQTVTINADSAVDFSQKITATIGAPHVSPVFTPDVQVGFKTNAAGEEIPGTRTISSIGLTVSTAITKVRWGMGRVDDENRAMIQQMVAEITAHEGRHRAIIENAATAALKDAQKFVGTKKFDAAKTALSKTLECTTNTAHEALDATEGKLTVSEVRQPDGTIKLSLSKSGSGAKYPCP